MSADGQELLETIRDAASKGSLSGLGRAILVSLARTEFILRLAGHEFGLLRGFFDSLEASVSTMSASQRVALADALEFHCALPTARGRFAHGSAASELSA